MKRTHRRKQRGGFFILFGSKNVISDDASVPAVHTVCPRCNHEAEMVGKLSRQWFTLFFLPLIPLPGVSRFTQCSHCGGQFAVTADQLQSRLAENEQMLSQEAITLYNSLRASLPIRSRSTN